MINVSRDNLKIKKVCNLIREMGLKAFSFVHRSGQLKYKLKAFEQSDNV